MKFPKRTPNRRALILGLLVSGSCTYGATVDRSAIQSAVLLSDHRTVILAYQELLYQPAEGIAAFPDGGVSRYLRDTAVIATQEVKGGKPQILQRIANLGLHGTASIALRFQVADPDNVLVVRSVQHSTSQASSAQWWRLGWRDGQVRPYPNLSAELAGRGRKLRSPEFGDLLVIDPDGTLLLGAQNEGRQELWLRRPNGLYDRLDEFTHYYGMKGAELYYWSGNEALVVNWQTRTRRTIARYDPLRRVTTRLISDDVTVRAVEQFAQAQPSVRVSSDRAAIIVHPANGNDFSLPLKLGDLTR